MIGILSLVLTRKIWLGVVPLWPYLIYGLPGMVNCCLFSEVSTWQGFPWVFLLAPSTFTLVLTLSGFTFCSPAYIYFRGGSHTPSRSASLLPPSIHGNQGSGGDSPPTQREWAPFRLTIRPPPTRVTRRAQQCTLSWTHTTERGRPQALNNQ